MSEYFFPKLMAVEALAPYRLRTTWNTGEVLELDVESRLRRYPALAPILDHQVFHRVHIGEWGNSIEWFDEEFGADNIYAWAKEQAGEVSHEMFDEWITRNELSLKTAAEALGISQRMVNYYRTAHKPIPRQTWLACLGWEAIKPNTQVIPRCLPYGSQGPSVIAAV
ncbi:MAG: DUF2442 domain-containing protein [Aquaspirillum sp.]|jgi:hypothetical protein|nr:DUF2442 domain-containing protein [Aquaspirillum sp.]